LHDELAQAADWQGKIVIDATNAYRVSLDELGGLPSSVVNPQALIGSRLVKAFNHLPARTLRRTQTSTAADGSLPVERRRRRSLASRGPG
jgi:predicted dinucleotide-binding enzyme